MSMADADSASGVPGTVGAVAGPALEDGDRDVGCGLPGPSADTTGSAAPLDLLAPTTLVDAATAAPLT